MMTLTYPHDRPLPHDSHLDATRTEEPFVPVYARTRSARGRKGGLKAWMILAPIGVLVLGAGAAALMSGGDEATAPLAEPAATAPVLPARPLLTKAAPVAETPVAAVEATPAPAPVVRRAAPAPVRRAAAPARAPAAAPTTAPRTATAPQPAGPQPYTATLNATPTATPAPATAQPPVIVIQPAN